jgi:hypothetical protein
MTLSQQRQSAVDPGGKDGHKKRQRPPLDMSNALAIFTPRVEVS